MKLKKIWQPEERSVQRRMPILTRWILC